MNLMNVRMVNLGRTLEALQETGCFFLAKINNSLVSIAQAGADDVGIYYFIPLICQKFSIPLPRAIDYFFYSMLAFSGIVFVIGIRLLSNWWITLYSVLSSFFLYREGFFRVTDTYIAAIFCTFSVIPLFLYVFKKQKKIFWYHYIYSFLVGLMLGYCHYIRIYSSLSVLIFIVLFILFASRIVLVRKIVLGCFFIAGISISAQHMNTLIKRSQSYMFMHGVKETVPYTHSFWHNVYAGLGYVDNYLEIKYNDNCAAQAARKINPHILYHSSEYEKILKNEVLRIVSKERFLFGSILFAKLGVLLFFVIACANIGLVAAYFYPKGILEYIFWISMVVAGLPGLMVVPRASYLSGLAAMAFVYGIYSLTYCLRKIE